MKGRKTTPTALKLVKGNPGKRPLNKREPKPQRGISDCPDHLEPCARVAWMKLCALLDAMGVLTHADAFALERLCDCYADILACRELVARDGRTYQTTGANGATLIKANPAVTQLRAADAQFKAYLTEFGLTPAARSKVQAAEPETDKTDPLAEFFA